MNLQFYIISSNGKLEEKLVRESHKKTFFVENLRKAVHGGLFQRINEENFGEIYSNQRFISIDC